MVEFVKHNRLVRARKQLICAIGLLLLGILLTACDAYMRDYGLVIPPDCTVALDARERRFTGYFFKKVLKADTRSSQSLRLSALKARSGLPA